MGGETESQSNIEALPFNEHPFWLCDHIITQEILATGLQTSSELVRPQKQILGVEFNDEPNLDGFYHRLQIDRQNEGSPIYIVKFCTYKEIDLWLLKTYQIHPDGLVYKMGDRGWELTDARSIIESIRWMQEEGEATLRFKTT